MIVSLIIFLKAIIHEIISPLTFVFNLSLVDGIVPSKMKTAKVLPVYKKGNADDVGNFRPISLLTSFSKLLEKLIYSRTIRFLNTCNILVNSQFGFHQKHSTTHVIIMLIDKVGKAIDNMSHTVGIFLDFSKDFDTINHEILLYKLSHYGIRGKTLKWFRSYLTGRTQFVSINHPNSNSELISCGVLQGSLLGPLLFIPYINDFQNSSTVLSFLLFAGDSNIFLSHKNPNMLLDILKYELNCVFEWIQADKLSLNLNKTNFILFKNTLTTLPG